MKKFLRWILHRYILITSGLVVVFVSIIFFKSKNGSTITINNHTLAVELAQTESERKQGLSDRDSMPQNTGLLFIFPSKDNHTFWNYQMKFPIDVLWIDDNMIVEKTLFPIDSGTPTTYYPRAKAHYVLEVNAGLADRYGWTVGTSVSLPRSLK